MSRNFIVPIFILVGVIPTSFKFTYAKQTCMQKQRHDLVKNLAQKYVVNNRHEVQKMRVRTTVLFSET